MARTKKQSVAVDTLVVKAQKILFSSFSLYRQHEHGNSFNKYAQAQFLYEFISDNTDIVIAPNFITFVSDAWDEYMREISKIDIEDVESYVKEMRYDYVAYLTIIGRIQRVIAAFNN